MCLNIQYDGYRKKMELNMASSAFIAVPCNVMQGFSRSTINDVIQAT